MSVMMDDNILFSQEQSLICSSWICLSLDAAKHAYSTKESFLLIA